MDGPAGLTAPEPWPERLLRLAGAAVLAAAAVACVAALVWAVSLEPALGTVPGWIVATAVALGYAAAGMGLVVALVVAARRRPGVALAVGAGAFVATRVAFLAATDVPLISDWQSYHELALGWLRGAPAIADQPMGYPILLATAYQVAGTSAAAGEGLNLLAATVGAAATTALVRLTAGGTAAVAALAMLAVTPTQLLFTAVRGSETIYSTLVAVLALALAALLGRLRDRPVRSALALACLIGIGLGLSTHVRPTGLALAPFVALLPLVICRDRRGGAAGAAIALGVAIGLAPATALNLVHLDRISPATSTYFGWQLLVGANVNSTGSWTRADVELVDRRIPGYRTGSVPNAYAVGDFDPARLRAAAERDVIARRLATGRIRRYNVQLVAIAPIKFGVGWGRADDAARWTLDLGRADRDSFAFRAARAASQAWWLVLLVLAAMAHVRHRGSLPLIVAAILLPVTAALVVLEVQSRYHEYVVPLVVTLAAVTVTVRVGAQGGSRSVTSRKS